MKLRSKLKPPAPKWTPALTESSMTVKPMAITLLPGVEWSSAAAAAAWHRGVVLRSQQK
jgi:hypothetical protein